MVELAAAMSVLAAGFIVMELAVRAILRLRNVRFDPPRRLRHLYLAPHPYLPYAFVPDITADNSEPARYTLHRGRYEFRALRTNAHRCIGAPLLPKADGTIRILCLGHSSTESSIWEVGGSIEHSLPLELGRYLRERSGSDRFEVVNCGVGGWTTAEIVVHFALNLLDLQPDIVILYQGLNDLTPSLTPDFRSDYSHARRNLAGGFWRIRLASRLPELTWWKSYSYAALRAIGSGNVRHDIHAKISLGRPDPARPFVGLATEQRNVESLMHLCRGNGIQLILSTFAYYLYSAASDDVMKLRLQQGVHQENEMLRSLAGAHGLPLIDIAGAIPFTDPFFLDSVHLTPIGMRFIAERFGDAVAALDETDTRLPRVDRSAHQT